MSDDDHAACELRGLFLGAFLCQYKLQGFLRTAASITRASARTPSKTMKKPAR